MDVVKIGKFIAEKRKAKGLTQLELANILFVTDRAVSKWECGRSLPDSSIMLKLCETLGISVNELLTGEELEMEGYNKQAEDNLLEMVKQKEAADKRLLKLEVVLMIVASIFLVAMYATAILTFAFLSLPLWALLVMFIVGFVVFIAAALVSVFIEQKAGYYECAQCGHKYVPTYAQVLFAPHINRTRYMKCPHCGKRSYSKKVISK